MSQLAGSVGLEKYERRYSNCETDVPENVKYAIL